LANQTAQVKPGLNQGAAGRAQNQRAGDAGGIGIRSNQIFLRRAGLRLGFLKFKSRWRTQATSRLAKPSYSGRMTGPRSAGRMLAHGAALKTSKTEFLPEPFCVAK
jgi:hypothetical protein